MFFTFKKSELASEIIIAVVYCVTVQLDMWLTNSLGWMEYYSSW